MARGVRRTVGGEVRGIVCGYCGCRMREPVSRLGVANSPRTMTEDHVFPQCRPQDMPDPSLIHRRPNRIWACLDCNRRKANLHPLHWLLIMPEHGWRLLVRKLHDLGVSDDRIEPVLSARRERQSRVVERRAELA